MTAPCRCQDLRRALLGLVRASRRRTDAKFDRLLLGKNEPDDTESITRYHVAVLRARRLLRETRQGEPVEFDSDEILTALRLLSAATIRYRNAEVAVCLAMDEEAFQDNGDNPEFTAALEEQSEAVRVLNEALAVAGRTKAKASSGGPSATEALNRIMAAWQAFNRATVPHAWSDSEQELHEALRSVASEFGGSK